MADPNLDQRFSRIEGKLTVLTWMVGAHIAISLAISAPALWLVIRIAAQID